MSVDAEIQIRWMIRRDLAMVTRIDRLSFPDAWCDDDFMSRLTQRNHIGIVAERRGRVVGYMVYQLNRGSFELHRLAVHPDYRECGVGRELVWKLRAKVSQSRREGWVIHVRESNLGGQKFFRAVGVPAVGVERDWFSSPDEDAFVFRYSVGKPARVVEFDADPDDDLCAGVG